MKHKVAEFIEEHQLIDPNHKVLVALSGGADSVALLCVLHAMGYHCEAAHCNFHLRGEESDRDEAFVRQLVQHYDVPLHVVHFDTARYASQHSVSIEMAARELRYAWFEEVRLKQRCDVVAVAHHRDDSVETLLLNLVRGSGINGLRGIPARNGHIVRPLLEVSRKEILDYLDHLQQGYVTDSTNLQDEFMRNKIRLNVLPLLETLNPRVAATINETAHRLSGVADIYHAAIEAAKARVMEGNRIVISRLMKEVSPATLLYELVYPLGFNSAQVNDLFRCLGHSSGKLFYSSQYTLLINRDEIVWQPLDKHEQLPELSVEYMEHVPGMSISSDSSLAYLDADLVTEPLELRHWKSGDRFMPLGMNRFKKVRDYLRDHKFSIFEKQRQCVVCSAGNIVWLVNSRIDNRYKVTPDTRRVMILKVR